MAPKPVVLCILDGWGVRSNAEANAPALANTPNFDRIMEQCPNTKLVTHGRDVGLPSGQMGNSEVGHTNIGAGRVVAMDLGQIDIAVEDGSFFTNAALTDFIAQLQKTGGTAHVMGVVSDGGVHGHIEHVLAALQALSDAGVPTVLHAVTDGRDVAPKSADRFMADLINRLPQGVEIGTVTGRYYAMDRDNRWDRVSTAYHAMINASSSVTAPDAATAITQSYAGDKLDEFIPATVIDGYAGASEGDGFFCLNFRADRAREILRAVAEPGFDAFAIGARPNWAALLGMVEYSQAHGAWMRTMFPPRDLVNTLA